MRTMRLRVISVMAALAVVLIGLNIGTLQTSAQDSAPAAPDKPTGTVIHVATLDIEWNDVPGAESYELQFFVNGVWHTLPHMGIQVAFYGPGAIVRKPTPEGTNYFRVRALNSAGASEWSSFLNMGNIHLEDWDGVPPLTNTSPTGTPTISGMAQVGETLTASIDDIEDENGLSRVKFNHQWVSNDGSADVNIEGATESTYTLVAADRGRTISVRVSYTDRGGFAESFISGATDTVVSAGPNSPATGQPTISGTAEVGQTLTAETSDIEDPDGLDNLAYSYQRLADDVEIAGATSSTYTLADADEGKTIKVTVSFTDDTNNQESLTSEPTAVIATPANSPATGPPTISGTAEVGQTLTAETSDIEDPDGLDNVAYSYQWLADDVEIAGATSSTYTLADADEGKTIKVTVSFTDDTNNQESLTSEPTAVIATPANSPATGPPTISGTAEVGQTLTAETSDIEDPDGLDNLAYSYQRLADDVEIAGATSSTYTLADADEGKTIKVTVSFTDDTNNQESLTSEPTAVVAVVAAGGVPISPPESAQVTTGASQELVVSWEAPSGGTIGGGLQSAVEVRNRGLRWISNINSAGRAVGHFYADIHDHWIDERDRVHGTSCPL